MSEMPEPLPMKTYNITFKEKTAITVKATSVAWTENGLFILLMDGDALETRRRGSQCHCGDRSL